MDMIKEMFVSLEQSTQLWIIGGGAIFLFALFKYLTRTKCPKCKSTNYDIINKVLLSSKIKVSKGEDIKGSSATHIQKNSYEDRTKVNKIEVTYQCLDCENIWKKKITTKDDLGRSHTGSSHEYYRE